MLVNLRNEARTSINVIPHIVCTGFWAKSTNACSFSAREVLIREPGRTFRSESTILGALERQSNTLFERVAHSHDSGQHYWFRGSKAQRTKGFEDDKSFLPQRTHRCAFNAPQVAFFHKWALAHPLIPSDTTFR